MTASAGNTFVVVPSEPCCNRMSWAATVDGGITWTGHQPPNRACTPSDMIPICSLFYWHWDRCRRVDASCVLKLYKRTYFNYTRIFTYLQSRVMLALCRNGVWRAVVSEFKLCEGGRKTNGALATTGGRLKKFKNRQNYYFVEISEENNLFLTGSSNNFIGLKNCT